VILKIIPEADYDIYTEENQQTAEKQRKNHQQQRRKAGRKLSCGFRNII
jgi:hypothetical protein